MSGVENQKTGDYAERLVLGALGRDFVAGKVTPDIGEDLLIEFNGYQAARDGTKPLRAYLQVRGGHRQGETSLTRPVELKHLRRWATHPLPVFLVGVAERDDPPAFYAKSVDDILTQDLEGKDLVTIPGDSVTVHLPRVTDLAGRLRTDLEAFYKAASLILEGLDETTIEQEHFEILRKRDPIFIVQPFASWTVLWKSPCRPQYMMAVLREVARRAQRQYSRVIVRPRYVIFHFYRSLTDVRHNLSVARIDWVDPSDSRASETIEILGAPGGFRIRTDRGVDESREFLRSRIADGAAYRQFASTIGAQFDALSDVILADLSPATWTDASRRHFEEVDNAWNYGPLAPLECASLEDVLKRQWAALEDHYHVSNYRKNELKAPDVARLLADARDAIQNLRGVWRALLIPR